MLDRRILRHRVRSRGPIQGHSQHRSAALLDQQTAVGTTLVGEPCRRTRIQPGNRARAIRSKAVAQRA